MPESKPNDTAYAWILAYARMTQCSWNIPSNLFVIPAHAGMTK